MSNSSGTLIRSMQGAAVVAATSALVVFVGHTEPVASSSLNPSVTYWVNGSNRFEVEGAFGVNWAPGAHTGTMASGVWENRDTEPAILIPEEQDEFELLLNDFVESDFHQAMYGPESVRLKDFGIED